jgi:hypothetical protein
MAAAEYNPVTTAPKDPNKFGILGDQYGWSGPTNTIPNLSDPNLSPTDLFGSTYSAGTPPSNIDASTTDLGALNPGSLFGTQFPSSSGQSWQDWLSSLGSLSSLGGSAGAPGAAGATPGATPASGANSGFLSNLLGSLGLSGAGATGLGPYAATAGIGLYEAKQAQQDAEKKANELKGLGQPLTDQAKQLLSQFNSGTLRPDQQQLVDFTKEQGQNLIASGTALSTIAQQAFQDYNSGKLPAADEKRLADKVAGQKQELRQRLGTAGITDSTLLVSQDAAIDNAAEQERQSLLDARFATGNQAYDEWLKSTTQGQQLVVAGQQFASQSFESMLNDALGFSTAGMEPVAQAIALQIQSDKELSDSISQLLGNLAAAYAYTVAGPGNAKAGGAAGGAGGAPGGAAGGGAGASGGGLGGLLSSIIGGVKTVGGAIGSIFSNSSSSLSSGGATGGSTSGGPTDFLGGYGGDFSSYPTANPSAAGGEAATDPSGIGFVTPTQQKVPVAGETGGDFTLSSALNTAGDLAGIYSGIEKGGIAGYAGAAGSAADLAGYNVPGLSYAGAVDQAAKGDIAGAGYSAMITAAGPVAALGNAIAQAANAPGKKDHARMNAVLDVLQQQAGWKPRSIGRGGVVYDLPNGTTILPNFANFKDYARAVTSGGSPEEIAAAWQKVVAAARPTSQVHG